MVNLNYAILEERDGGYYERKESTDFGTEDGAIGIEGGGFATEAEGLADLTSYFGDHDCTAEDVTEARGFAGWGTVLSVHHHYLNPEQEQLISVFFTDAPDA